VRGPERGDVEGLVVPALSQRGLRITGPGGTQIITPRLITPERLSAVAGTVFIAVKAAALEAVIKEIGPAVGTPDP
jgi:ketopantoate reductase